MPHCISKRNTWLCGLLIAALITDHCSPFSGIHQVRNLHSHRAKHNGRTINPSSGCTRHSSSSPLSVKEKAYFDPLGVSSERCHETWTRGESGNALLSPEDDDSDLSGKNNILRTTVPMMMMVALITLPSTAVSAAEPGTVVGTLLSPQNFNPVCPASDGFYRFLQGSTEAVVGREAFVEYGPLIAGGLLRIRLELCVVESFFNEAVGPFIQQNGLTWILPVHETVETFLAGTIFSLASTFILVGSTKIITVVVTYSDVFLGVPARLLGGFAFDRARGKPVTLDIGFGPFKTRVIGPPDTKKSEDSEEEPFIDFEKLGPVELGVVAVSGTLKLFGETSRVLREVTEAADLFVGRYLVLIATGYIGLKFLHYKVIPDFP